MKKYKPRDRGSPNMLNLKAFFKKPKTKEGWEQEHTQRFKSEPKDKPNFVQHPCRLLTNHQPLN